MIKNVLEANAERERLEFRIDAFLRKAGWKSTSATPGHYWMWERVIDGRTVLCSKELALSIQATLDEPEEGPVSG